MEPQNPLDQISNWLHSIDEESLIDLINLAGHFHDDLDIEPSKERQKERFFDYLSTDNLTKVEMVRHTLFMIKLIDFSLAGRDTEDGWTEVLDRLLYMRTKGAEKGLSTKWIDDQLDKHEERKEKWIAISSSWYRLIQEQLTNRKVADWYFFDMISK